MNAIFEPQEQVSPVQIDLLGAAFMLATVSPAQTRVGTGAGGSHFDLHWDGKKYQMEAVAMFLILHLYFIHKSIPI